MLKTFITFSAACAIFTTSALASNQDDVLVRGHYFLGDEYVWGSGAENRRAKVEESDKVVITPDARLLLIKQNGVRRSLKGCRYGQSGFKEDGTPNMLQADYYTYIKFDSALDPVSNRLPSNTQVKVNGLTAEIYTADGKLIQEFFYLHHAAVPEIFKRNPELLGADYKVLDKSMLD